MRNTYFSILMAISVLAVFSCSKNNLDSSIKPDNDATKEETKDVLMSFTTPAVISSDTKMTYDIDNTGFKKTWVTGDQLIGYVREGEGTDADPYKYKYFTFQGTVNGETVTWNRVDGVDGYPRNPEASSSYTIYFAFAPGQKAKSFEDYGFVSIDISNQINGQIPVLMTAEGNVTSGGNITYLNFTNHLALLYINNVTFTDADENEVVNYISLSNVDGKVKIDPAGDAKCSTITDAKLGKGITVGQSNGSTAWKVGGSSNFAEKVFIAFPIVENKTAVDVVAETAYASYKYSILSRTFPKKLYKIQSTTEDERTFERTAKSTSDIVATLYNGEDKIKSYYVFNDAIVEANAVTDYDPILVLEKNVVLAGDVPAFTNATKEITLNLNNHTITTGSNCRICVTGDGAKLKITGDTDGKGEIKAKAGTEAASPVIAENMAQLTITSGTFTSDPTPSNDIDAAVYAKTGAKLIINGGSFVSNVNCDEGAIGCSSDLTLVNQRTSLEITGGTIQGHSSRRALRIIRSNVSITSGKIQGYIYATGDDESSSDIPEVNITGGEVSCTSNSNHTIRAAKYVNVNISDGKIESEKKSCFTADDNIARINVYGGTINLTGDNTTFVTYKTGVETPWKAFNITGGTFNKSLDFVTPGYEQTGSESAYSVGTVSEAKVALFGTDLKPKSSYSTVEGATAVWTSSNNRLYLIEDVNLGAALDISGKRNRTIDLNGKTLTCTNAYPITLSMNNGFKVTITSTQDNGKITTTSATGDKKPTISVGGSACLEISGMTTIEGTYRTVFVESANTTAALILNDNYSKIIGNGSSGIYADEGIVNISGGKVESNSTNALVYLNAATIGISGGFFKQAANKAVIYNASTNKSPGKCVVTGGYFANSINSSHATVQDGYECVPNSEYEGYTYKVQTKTSN